ncbi:MAG: hypothetical protein JRM99_03035 [Nitrososphaerota archaeon]|nr:hypothetical protein [Nitrososphaerota archaeon]
MESKSDCAEERTRIDIVAAAVMTLALFGFLGNAMIDFNWGNNFLVNSVALAYWFTLRWMIPFPINYWGAGAAIYFAIFLLSFAVLARIHGLHDVILETVILGSSTMTLFELGVFYFVPSFWNTWTMSFLRGTPLGNFTNADLFWSSLVAFGLSVVVFYVKRRRIC